MTEIINFASFDGHNFVFFLFSAARSIKTQTESPKKNDISTSMSARPIAVESGIRNLRGYSSIER